MSAPHLISGRGDTASCRRERLETPEMLARGAMALCGTVYPCSARRASQSPAGLIDGNWRDQPTTLGRPRVIVIKIYAAEVPASARVPALSPAAPLGCIMPSTPDRIDNMVNPSQIMLTRRAYLCIGRRREQPGGRFWRSGGMLPTLGPENRPPRRADNGRSAAAIPLQQ